MATYFLNELIAMSMLMMAKRRKKRAFDTNSQFVSDVLEVYHEGKPSLYSILGIYNFDYRLYCLGYIFFE